jgi:hypothetical protein
MTSEQAILAQERRALDEWAAGRPSGFTVADADDATYFDDLGAHRRLDGLAAIRAYMQALEGKIPPHRYDVVDPRVQLYGDTAVLTLRYHPSDADGHPLQPWKATSVYRRVGADWRRVHAHWSMVKEA